jgi:hypothetical protein
MLRELRRAPWWVKGILTVVGLFVVLAIVGSAIGSDEESPESAGAETARESTHEPEPTQAASATSTMTPE